MEIREITEKKEWEDFLLECKDKTFLHSWNWGEFQNEMREKVWRFGVFKDNQLIAVSFVVKIVAKRGSFLLVPHGPVSKKLVPEILEPLFLHLKGLGEKEGVSFIRINPVWKRGEGVEDEFERLKFRKASMQMHPEASWKLDISKDEDDLLSDMRKTTRYLIRQTQKNEDITIEKSANIKDIELFSTMHKEVSKRQKFVPFSIEYLSNEFSSFAKDNEILLLFGKYKGEIAAASFVIFWSGIGFYHHAASLPKFSKHSIPYLLQWEAMKEAKKRGCIMYDFWGYVNPKEHPSHPWAGPTLFKMGFGGSAHEYVKTYDYPLNKGYWKTWLFETARRVKRGL